MKHCSLFQDIFILMLGNVQTQDSLSIKLQRVEIRKQKELCRVLTVTLLKEEKNELTNKSATPMKQCDIVLIDEDQNYYFSPTKDA